MAIVALRWRQRLGSAQIAGHLQRAHRRSAPCRINRLSRIDRLVGERARRYEDPHSESLIHIDDAGPP